MKLRACWIVVVLVACGKPATKHQPPAEAGSAVLSSDAASPRSMHQGEACPAGTTCDPGLTCVAYRGVGGNELHSCEIPCTDTTACPSGQSCGVVADGPGRVCITGGAPPVDAGAIVADAGRATVDAGHATNPCGGCASGLTCVEYRGVGGNELHSCERSCAGGAKCPAGQECTTVRDGPANVCVGASGSGGGAALPAQGKACPEGKCAAGLECVEYYGIAGPRGPKFTSCEIRCSADKPCAKPQRCITIADGPGQVCRP